MNDQILFILEGYIKSQLLNPGVFTDYTEKALNNLIYRLQNCESDGDVIREIYSRVITEEDDLQTFKVFYDGLKKKDISIRSVIIELTNSMIKCKMQSI